MSKSGSSVRESVNIPLIEDPSQDVGDGCSLAVLISFYCPSALSRQGQHTSGSDSIETHVDISNSRDVAFT